MQPNFLYIFIFILALIGCEIDGLENTLYQTNILIIFLALSFLAISTVKYFSNDEEIRTINKAEICLFFYLIWAAGSFYYSINPDITSFPAMKSLGALAFGLGLFLYLKSINQLTQLWLVSFVFAGIHGISGIIEQFFPFYLNSPLKINGSSSLFSHPNFYACYLQIHVPIGLYLFFKTDKGFLKTLISIGWISIIISLAFTGSIAGQLIAGLQIVVSLWFFKNKEKFDQARVVVLGLIIGITIFFGLNKFLFGGQPIIEFKQVMASTNIDHLYFMHIGNRLVYWLGGWEIFVNHWLAGSGLATFSELYPFTGLFDIYPKSGLPPHAHNLYVQTASDTGLIGLSLLVACPLWLIIKFFKNFDKSYGDIQGLKFFLFLSLSGFLIHNISEYNWLNSLFIYYFTFQIVSMGFILNIESSNNARITDTLNKRILFSTLTLSIILIGLTLSNYNKYNQIILKDVLASHSHTEVHQKLDKAKRLCEGCSMPHYLSGLSNLSEAKKYQNADLLNRAQNDFSEVLKRNPYNSKVYMVQGDILNIQGNRQKAEKSYQMALRDSRYKEIALKKLKNLEKLE